MNIIHLTQLPDLTKCKSPWAKSSPSEVVRDFLKSPYPACQLIPEDGEYKDITSCGMSYYATIKFQGLSDRVICAMRGNRLYLIKGEYYHG